MIHDHIIYDQLLQEQEPSPKFINKYKNESSFKILKNQNKPFTLQRNEQSERRSRQKKLKYFINKKSERSEQSQSRNKEQQGSQKQEQEDSLIYDLDFESYQESHHMNSRPISKYCLSSHKSSRYCKNRDRRQINQSAQLPSISKLISTKMDKRVIRNESMFVRKKMKRKSIFSKKVSIKGKSQNILSNNEKQEILELKNENIRLLQKIKELRKIKPILINNYDILRKQEQQIKKLQSSKKYFFDVEYELHLDKQLESTERNQIKIKNYIKQKSQRIKKKEVILDRKIKKMFPKQSDSINDLQDVQKVREYYLTKKRQEYQYECRILQLEKKTMQYNQIVADYDNRIYLGMFSDLTIKKTQLQQKILTKKQELKIYQQHLEGQIKQLQDDIKKTEAHILSVSFELRNKNSSSTISDRIKDNPETKEQKKSVIFRFFKKRRQ